MKLLAAALALVTASTFAQAPLNPTFARDPKQPVDQPYTDAIHKYTTGPNFLSPLVDYLPASKTVPRR